MDLSVGDPRSQLRAAGGAHVVIDPVGDMLSEQALRAMRPGGRFVTVGYASGKIPRIPLNLVLLKDVAIRGLEMRMFLTRHPERAVQARAELLQLLAGGQIRPYVGARFPLERAAAALRALADRSSLGKSVLDIEQPSPSSVPATVTIEQRTDP